MNQHTDSAKRVSVWKGSFQGGLIMGISGSLYLIGSWFTDNTFSTLRGVIWIPILLILLFYVMKQFRDTYRGGYATFGEAFGPGAVASIYYGVIMALMVFLLYGVIDPDLPAKQLAFAEAKLLEMGLSQQEADMAMIFQKKLATLPIITLGQLFSSTIGAIIGSLIIALFVRKEGNPMLTD